MEGLDEKISALEDRIDRLVRTQIGFQTEISALREELSRLRSAGGNSVPAPIKTGTAAFNSRPDSAANVRTRSIFPASADPPNRSSDTEFRIRLFGRRQAVRAKT